MTAQCALHMGALKIRESLSTPTATFAEIFNGLLFWSILWMCVQNWKFIGLPVPEIIAIEFLGLHTPNLGEEKALFRGSGMVPRERELVISYRPSIVTFPLSFAFQRYCRFCAPARHFFPPHLWSPQNFPMFSWATKSEGVGLIVRTISF